MTARVLTCLSRLACPVCTEALAPGDPPAVRCPNGHAFDVARGGWVTLAGTGPKGKGRIGDDAPMLDAREAFFAAGHLAAVTAVIAQESAASGAPGAVLEIGCGPGHHLRAALDALERPPACVIALDLAREAVRRCVRRVPEAAGVVADAQTALPVADGAVDLLISAFSPRPTAEIARTVAPGGTFLAAFAGPGHLAALRGRYDLLAIHPAKRERLEADLGSEFALEATRTAAALVLLSPADAANAIAMGPNARHATTALEDFGRGEDLADRVEVEVLRFRRAG